MFEKSVIWQYQYIHVVCALDRLNLSYPRFSVRCSSVQQVCALTVGYLSVKKKIE
jgi:hypothetical protein